MSDSAFNIDLLESILSRHLHVDNIVVAYSGGLDSHVLLHALKCLSDRCFLNIKAVHINHGLSPNAAFWSDHCYQVCRNLGINIETICVHAEPDPGCSPEAAARDARYKALFGSIQNDQVLLTAHHQDDQCETLLLQLFRGAGLRGLSAMPEIQFVNGNRLLRPLLGVSRDQLRIYAERNGLEWVDDESNFDTNPDRNYLRHIILPEIKKRWPAVRENIARTAFNAAETVSMAEILARQDRVRASYTGKNALDMKVLAALDVPRCYNLLRTWIRDNNYPVPSRRVLSRIVTELFNARKDRIPVVSWEGGFVRRYNNNIYITPELPSQEARPVKIPRLYPGIEMRVSIGKLKFMSDSNGLDARLMGNHSLTIRFRRGGEKMHPGRRNKSIKLKNIFQEYGLETWLRNHCPLIYADDQLIAVAGICIDDRWKARENNGLYPVWELPKEFETFALFK